MKAESQPLVSMTDVEKHYGDFHALKHIDLDIHELAGDFGTCRRHFDVVYGAVAETADLPRVSEESIDVAWFPVGRLPEDLMPDLVERLPQLYRATAEVFAQGA